MKSFDIYRIVCAAVVFCVRLCNASSAGSSLSSAHDLPLVSSAFELGFIDVI